MGTPTVMKESLIVPQLVKNFKYKVQRQTAAEWMDALSKGNSVGYANITFCDALKQTLIKENSITENDFYDAIAVEAAIFSSIGTETSMRF